MGHSRGTPTLRDCAPARGPAKGGHKQVATHFPLPRGVLLAALGLAALPLSPGFLDPVGSRSLPGQAAAGPSALIARTG